MDKAIEICIETLKSVTMASETVTYVRFIGPFSEWKSEGDMRRYLLATSEAAALCNDIITHPSTIHAIYVANQFGKGLAGKDDLVEALNMAVAADKENYLTNKNRIGTSAGTRIGVTVLFPHGGTTFGIGWDILDCVYGSNFVNDSNKRNSETEYSDRIVSIFQKHFNMK